ncbi:MAG TPA: LURP-one-related family protein [Candidatus Dormibacteraeota bacterium]|nr:LURP-one-related family protein [Candidatus Dormibacteraeota bacterium]
MAVTAGWTTFQLRRQMISIGEDFWIANAQGESVYKLDGKVLTLTQTFALQDASGNELARMRAEMLTLRRTMDIERGGQVVAVVKKAFINILSQSFTVDIAGDGELQAHGDILNHEFQITGPDGVVATVSRQWFIGDLMYGIAIAPGQDEVLMLCIAIAIDEMSEADRRR